MDVNEKLRGYKRLDYDGRDCILVPLEDPLARRIKEENLVAYTYNPNGFLIVERDQLIAALQKDAAHRWESPEQKKRRLGHYEGVELFGRKFEPEWWQHKIVRRALIIETSNIYNMIMEMWSRHDLSEEDSLWLMQTGDDASSLLKQALDALTGPGEPTRYLTDFMRLPLPPALKGLRPYEDLYANTHALVERAKMGEDVKVSLALFEPGSMAELLESIGNHYDPTLDNLLKAAQTADNYKR